MISVENEECPVCFRVYSETVVPITILCGHSFCQDCSGHLQKCPICRKRIATNQPRPTNYSLLSLVNRVNSVGRKETKDVEIQTEKPPKLTRPLIPRGMQVTTPGITLSVMEKLSKIKQQLAKIFHANSNLTPN